MDLRYVIGVTVALLAGSACTYQAAESPPGNPLDRDYETLTTAVPAAAEARDTKARATPPPTGVGTASQPSAPRAEGRWPSGETDASGTGVTGRARESAAREVATDRSIATAEDAGAIATFVDVAPERAAPALPPPTIPSPTVPTPPSSRPESTLDRSTTDALPEAPDAPSHAAFDQLLRTYVDARGRVDYAGMKNQHAKLKVYLNELSMERPDDSWTRDERLAYWINAYNAATLDLILDNYPLKSIKDLDGGKPWDVKRVKLDGNTYSLNEIENSVIRPRFREPRIHFAVNCAARGCPPLRNEAFVAERLDRQLAEQTRKFLNDPAYTNLDGETLTVSRIFDWYGEDFGDVADFVRGYRDDVPAGAQVAYSDYDWALNGK